MDYVLMREDHLEQIAELEKQCFSDPWSLRSITSELNNPLSLWIVAECDGTVAGYVGSQSVLGEADMMNLAVSPLFRRQGVASGLVEALIKHLKERDVHVLVLEVRASNEPAIRLYEKYGFVQVGRRPNYYAHPKEDALILRKEWKD
jgi:ribosomal-protein-alanine N-acetyltransferase